MELYERLRAISAGEQGPIRQKVTTSATHPAETEYATLCQQQREADRRAAQAQSALTMAQQRLTEAQTEQDMTRSAAAQAKRTRENMAWRLHAFGPIRADEISAIEQRYLR